MVWKGQESWCEELDLEVLLAATIGKATLEPLNFYSTAAAAAATAPAPAAATAPHRPRPRCRRLCRPRRRPRRLPRRRPHRRLRRRLSRRRSSSAVSSNFLRSMEDGDLTFNSQNEKNKAISGAPIRIDDRATSDVVVRLRTTEGRDNWFYCHSEILIEKSKYFAERLSEDWPTCQILDSRNCVEVAVHLGCDKMAHACSDYLEAAPWEEAEEEEIVRTIPSLGSHYEKILSRLHPVDSVAVVGIFISTLRFATSSLPVSMQELKSSSQEQLEYMLTEDDDAPLLTSDNTDVKTEVKNCMKDMLARFNCLMEYLSTTEIEVDACKVEDAQSLLSDISWLCQILAKMEMMKDLVHYWVEVSDKIVRMAENDMLETRLKVVEIVAKVLDAISLGNAIITTVRRVQMVKVWLPFVQRTRPMLDEVDSEGDQILPVKMETEVWQNLESSFVSLVLTLPANEQAEILAEWLKSKHVRYPDLTEAFEVWCYRSKVARRRLALSTGANGMITSELHAPSILHSAFPWGEEEAGS